MTDRCVRDATRPAGRPDRAFLREVILLSFILLGGVGLPGCSGPETAPEETIEEMPDWMTEKPETESYLFGTGTAVSEGMQTALDKAKVRARGDLASTLEVRFQGLTEDFQEEVGEEYLNQFTQAQRTIVNQFLVGTEARETELTQEGGRYRAYALMEMPIGKASQELMSKLQQNEELYTRFRASEAFDRLQDQIEKYEKAQEEAAQTKGSEQDGSGQDGSGQDGSGQENSESN